MTTFNDEGRERRPPSSPSASRRLPLVPLLLVAVVLGAAVAAATSYALRLVNL